MTVSLYVVMGENNLWDYLVCAKSGEDAVRYVVKNALLKLRVKPATPMDVAMFKDNGHEVLGEANDLDEFGSELPSR